jgi:hypothetical protein
MKTKWMLLSGVLMAAAPAAAQAATVNRRPLVVTNLTGELRIEQSLPAACGDVDQATQVTGGRMEITPAEGYEVTDGRRFDLTSATVTFAPFLIRRSCYLQSEVRDYTALAVQLGVAAAPFKAVPSSPEVYDLTISRDDIVLYQAAAVNGGLETGYKRPTEDVTGTLDFQIGTITLRMVIGTKLHIKGGCAPVGGCVVDGHYEGTLTATIAGTLVFPDSDGDGVPDRDDNCTHVANGDQRPVANPVVRPPADLTVSSCAATRIGTGLAIDICDFKTATLSNDAPGVLEPGKNLITWRGSVGDSVATATQNVTVVDKTRPQFALPPADLALTTCMPGKLTKPAAIDDCGATVVTSGAPAVFPIGPSVVHWTAADLTGNQTTTTQAVSVTDQRAPTVLCAAVPTAPGVFQVGARDDCGSATMNLGSYALSYGERIGITLSDRPGVRLVGTMALGLEKIRLFEVGKGEMFVTARDEAGNAATAYCR